MLVLLPLLTLESVVLVYEGLYLGAILEIMMLTFIVCFFGMLWKKPHYFGNAFVIFSCALCFVSCVFYIEYVELLIFYIAFPTFYIYFLGVRKGLCIIGILVALLVASALHFSIVNNTLPWPVDTLIATSMAFFYVCLLTTAYEKTNSLLLGSLKQKAEIDDLTNIYNRRTFFDLFQHELERAKRNALSLTLLILDVDHFKSINDNHGHHVGDATLRSIAQRCSQSLRKSDIIGRIGGEELACLLLDTNGGAAAIVAEKLRGVIAESGDGELPHCTVSIGMTAYRLDDTVSEMYKRADAALYAAKTAGRNRVMDSSQFAYVS